jgi:hypothetical protein
VWLCVLSAHALEVNDAMRDLLEDDQIMLLPDFDAMKSLNEYYMTLDRPPKNVLEVSKPLS